MATVLTAPGTTWEQGRSPSTPTMPKAQEMVGQDPRLAMAAASAGADVATQGKALGESIQNMAKNIWEQQKTIELKALGQEYEAESNKVLTGYNDADTGVWVPGLMEKKGLDAQNTMAEFTAKSQEIADKLKSKASFGGQAMDTLDLMFKGTQNAYTRTVANHQITELKQAKLDDATRQMASAESLIAMNAANLYGKDPGMLRDQIYSQAYMIIDPSLEKDVGPQKAALMRESAIQSMSTTALRAVIKNQPDKALDIIRSVKDGTNGTFTAQDIKGSDVVSLEGEAREIHTGNLHTQAIVLVDQGKVKEAMTLITSDPNLSPKEALKYQTDLTQRARFNRSMQLQEQAQYEKVQRGKGLDMFMAGGKLNDVSLEQLQRAGLKGEVLYSVWTAGQSMLHSAAAGQKMDLPTYVGVVAKLDDGTMTLADLSRPENAATLAKLGHDGFMKALAHSEKVGNMGEDGKRNYSNAKEVFKGVLSGVNHGSGDKDKKVADGLQAWEIEVDAAAKAAGGWGKMTPTDYANINKNLTTKVVVPGAFSRPKTLLELKQAQISGEGYQIPDDLKAAISEAYVKRTGKVPTNDQILKTALRPENQAAWDKQREKNGAAQRDKQWASPIAEGYDQISSEYEPGSVGKAAQDQINSIFKK